MFSVLKFVREKLNQVLEDKFLVNTRTVTEEDRFRKSRIKIDSFELLLFKVRVNKEGHASYWIEGKRELLGMRGISGIRKVDNKKFDVLVRGEEYKLVSKPFKVGDGRTMRRFNYLVDSNDFDWVPLESGQARYVTKDTGKIAQAKTE